MAYANGLIPTKALMSIGGGQALESRSARAWLALVAAAAKAGFTLRLTDSYRPRSLQEFIFFDRYEKQLFGGGHYGDVKWYKGARYVRKAGTASAATPGTSIHGSGFAVDITGISAAFGAPSTPAYRWLAANAGAYGWVNPAWAKTRNYWEPWHWEYSKSLDRSPTPAKRTKLKITGHLNAATIRTWQTQRKTNPDGVISTPESSLVRSVRAQLNRKNGKGGYKLRRPLTGEGEWTKRDWQAIQQLLNLWAARKTGRRIKLIGRPLNTSGKPDPRTIKALNKSLNAKLWK